MWLRWVLVPLFYGAGASASSRREPAFVPLVSGLPRRGAYAKLDRRRHVLFNCKLITPRLRIVSPRTDAPAERSGVITFCDGSRSQLLAHMQEAGDKVEQSFFGKGDDDESGSEDNELERAVFTIFRRLARVTSRNRRDGLKSPPKHSNSGEDEAREQSFAPVLASSGTGNDLHEGGDRASVTPEKKPLSWSEWLSGWRRPRKSSPILAATEATPCIFDNQTSGQTKEEQLEPEGNERRIPQEIVESPPGRPAVVEKSRTPNKSRKLSMFTPYWPWGELGGNDSRSREARESEYRRKTQGGLDGIERSGVPPKENKDAAQSSLLAMDSPTSGDLLPSSDSQPRSPWPQNWSGGHGTKSDPGYRDIKEKSEENSWSNSSDDVAEDDPSWDGDGSKSNAPRSSTSFASGMERSRGPPQTPVWRRRLLSRTRVVDGRSLLSTARRPFLWVARVTGIRSAAEPSSPTSGSGPPTDVPREPEERIVEGSTLTAGDPPLGDDPETLELISPGRPPGPIFALVKAAGRPFSVIRRRSLAALAAVAVRSYTPTDPDDDAQVEPGVYRNSTVDTFPLYPASSVLRQRLVNYPFFPARAPRRPPGYRWIVSTISSERNRRRNKKEAATDGERLETYSSPDASSSSSPDTPGEEDEASDLGSRRIRILNALSGVTAEVISGPWRRSKPRGVGSNPVTSAEREPTPAESPQSPPDRPLQEIKRGDMEPIERLNGDAEASDLPAVPWWRYGAVAAVSMALSLARHVNSGLAGSPSAPGVDSSEDLEREEVEDLGQEQASSNPRESYDVPDDVPLTSQHDGTPAVAGILESVTPVQSQPRNKSRVRSLAKRIATTSRRLKLWLLLRRASTARAEPLLPGVETAISTLPVPLTTPEGEVEQTKQGENDASATDGLVPGRRTTEDSKAAAAAAASVAAAGTSAKDRSSEAAMAPQAVGGGAWNMFGFFPNKDEEVRNGFSEARKVIPAVGSTNASENGKGAPVAWPMPMQLDGNDSEAEVEAGMIKALRAAFGYRTSDSDDRPEETAGTSLPVAEAATPSPSTPRAEVVDTARRGQGDETQDSDGMSLTSRYLDELSPNSGSLEWEKGEDSSWLGAEAAAAAAGAAAGVAAGAAEAAEAAAGAAAEAAAAAAATMAVAAESLTFGGGRDDSDSGWQGGSRWGRRIEVEESDVECFGEGPLNVKAKELDPLKAQDMILDPFSSAGLKRSVASQELQGQRGQGLGILAAAVSLARLPLPWKSMAAVEAETDPTPNNGGRGIQGVALRRLGRVGVGQIASSMLLVSSEIALQVNSVEELAQFREAGGMPKLLMALSPKPYTTKAIGITAIRNLVRVCPESVTAEILQICGVEGLGELRRLLGAPGEPWSSAAASAAAAAVDSFDAMRLQAEAVQLLQELAMASDEALELVRDLPDLLPALRAIARPGTGPLGRIRDRVGQALAGTGLLGVLGVSELAERTYGAEAPTSRVAVSAASKLLSMLGAHEWRPRHAGQRGLRILSLDGGGTRGVMTIAILREVLKGIDKDVHELFDVICGTSTGGILAMLFAQEKESIEGASDMYDSLIVRIFRKDILGNAKLVLIQAQYSAMEWESILEEILSDRRMIDMCEDPNSPKVIICSTIINSVPLQMVLWRNYGYDRDQTPVYKGDFRRKMRECLRATTAAPSYFTPLTDGDTLYADGAFMANNPTCIALTEAKLLYPGVPIECILSVGTGYHEPKKDDRGMSWNTVVSQLVNSATDTEAVDSMLSTFLSRDIYFRFNPSIEPFSIDETRPEKLEELKVMAKEYASRPEVQARIKEFQAVLNGEAGSGLLGVGAATSALSAVVAAASKLAAGAMDNGSVTASRRKPFS